MTNERTNEILNDADGLIQRMNQTIFYQDVALDTDPNIDWQLGEPLYPQEFDVDYTGVSFKPAVRCEPCGVSWNGPDPCWNCGENRFQLSWPDVAGINQSISASADALRMVFDVAGVNQSMSVSMDALRMAFGGVSDAASQAARNIEQINLYAALSPAVEHVSLHAFRETTFDWPTIVEEWADNYRRAHVYEPRRGSRHLGYIPTFYIYDEVSEFSSPEPEMVTVNGITFPKEFPTTVPMPLPNMTVSSRMYDNHRPFNGIITEERRSYGGR